MLTVTPEVRCSYTDVIVAKESEDGKSAAWQGTAMFSKKDPEHLAWLKNAAAEYDKALASFFPDPAKRPRIKFMGDPNSPCKDGDITLNRMGIPLKEKNPEYADHYLLRFSAVAKSTDPKTGAVKTYAKRHPVFGSVWDPGTASWNIITDPAEIYGGCWGRFRGNFYHRKRSDNPGVSVGLSGFQKTRDDEPFGAPRVTSADFGALPGMNDPANYAPDPLGMGTPPQTSNLFGDDIPF